MKTKQALVTLFMVLSATSSSADVAVLLHEGIGSKWKPNKVLDTGFLTQGGHAGVLLTNLCMETPVKLRLCRDNEPKGVVISRYDKLSSEGYDWLIVPAHYYFYGTPTADQTPLIGSTKISRALAKNYYQTYLINLFKKEEGDELPKGRWEETLSISHIRDVYAFQLHTSLEQDIAIINRYNLDRNQSNFNFFYRNCAAFARDLMSFLFKGEIGININDALLISPKGVALETRQLGKEKAELNYQVKRYTKIPGLYDESLDNLFALENMTDNIKYAVPLLIFQPHLTAGAALFYKVLRPFDAHDEFENYFDSTQAHLSRVIEKYADSLGQLNSLINSSQHSSGVKRIELLQKNQQLFQQIKKMENIKKIRLQTHLGSQEDWQSVQNELDQIINSLIEKRFLNGRDSVKTLLSDLDSSALYEVTDAGLQMNIASANSVQSLILTRSGIKSGDKSLAIKVLLGRLHYTLKSSSKNRLNILEARKDLSDLSTLVSNL